MSRPRSFRRHLLAMCTFLVPLGAFAWLGWIELGRQAGQVRSAVDREALQFLSAAAAALEQRLDQLLPAVALESESLLEDHLPATAVRLLRRAGHGYVLDIVLLDDDGRLRYPEPASQRLGLPFHRDPGQRSDDATADSLQLADLLLTRGRFDDAERHLQAALGELAAGDVGRRRLELALLEAPLQFRLATVERKLGHAEPARAAFRRVLELAAALRGPGRSLRFDRLFDSDALCCGLLAELALAETADDVDPCLDLLRAIAGGERDHLGEPLLQAVADRAGAAAMRRDHGRAEELAADVAIHLRTRAFAADYDRFLQETVARRLHAHQERPAAGGSDLRQVITAGNPSSLLLLRPAQGQELERAAWVGLRLDLGQLLAGAVEPFVRGDGSFVLAISDGDDQPVVAAPTAPDDYTPPALASHGMMLRAFPADVAGYLAEARAAQRNSTLLLLGLLIVAATGALWLWRSVSRESELLGLKVELVSRVSHELKTPLALISLYGETLSLKRARDADQAAQFGGVIAREAARLTAMIQQILDFSRQEAGTLQYDPQPTDLAAALAEVAATYSPHLEAKGAALETDLEHGVTAAVDRTAFASAVVNLLENAVKYGAEDGAGPRLRLELRRTSEHALVDVLDRGRGVPPAERDRVFDSFYRASNAGEVRGAGLGLHLVRHFAVAHGGTATTMPRPGGGSIFRLCLPIRPALP